MTSPALEGVIRRTVVAAHRIVVERKTGTLSHRREKKRGTLPALAATLRYLGHRTPDVIPDAVDRVVWRTPDGAVTVPAPAGDDFVTDMTLTVTGEDGGAEIRLRDPVALAAAILSGWMCLDHPTDGDRP